jgi:hypothetical protein
LKQRRQRAEPEREDDHEVVGVAHRLARGGEVGLERLHGREAFVQHRVEAHAARHEQRNLVPRLLRAAAVALAQGLAERARAGMADDDADARHGGTPAFQVTAHGRPGTARS